MFFNFMAKFLPRLQKSQLLQNSCKNCIFLFRKLQNMHKSDKLLAKIEVRASKNLERLQKKNDRKMIQTPLVELSYSRGTALQSRKPVFGASRS